MKNVRTRFAPSPTGLMHVGNIRTGLFAWLLARQNNGKFILRLEDTDQKREVKGADKHIFECLNALGIDYDEGPDIGGSYGPYRQSERLDIYTEWAEKLLDSGRAYADPYSPQEVQAFREKAQKDKIPFLYRNHRHASPPNWDGMMPLRFKSEPKSYNWHDEVMGDLSTGPEVIDDFVLIKSDGYPTYNFAHIIDDMLMKCSHVIRGQEFLASTPNYLNLYEALGIEKPILATMPHILNIEGNKKLSKRDGAKDVLDYVKEGYPVGALVNFIASMGWNDGTEQEVFTVEELISKFNLQRVQKSGARFDEKRLLWLSGAHIRNMTVEVLMKSVQDYWPEEAKGANEDYKQRVLGVVQERLKYFAELPDLTKFFFVEQPVNLELITGNKQLNKLDKSELVQLLELSKSKLHSTKNNTEDISTALNELLVETSQKPAILFSLIRIAITQVPSSPGLADTINILGIENSVKRIERQIKALG